MLLYSLISLSILLLNGNDVASAPEDEGISSARYYGPYDMVWSNSQCATISYQSLKSLGECEDICDTTGNCTAFCFNGEDQCELKGCKLPVPQPANRNPPWLGYSKKRVVGSELTTPSTSIVTSTMTQNKSNEGSRIYTTSPTNATITVTQNNKEKADHKKLRDPDCLSVMLLVALPITHQHSSAMRISTTHAYVLRCIGAFDKEKACMSEDQVEQMEHGDVVLTNTGTKDEEFIHVNWVSHSKCKYKPRKCPIEDSIKCYQERNTHYYDEDNCTCACIVQIDEMETCLNTTIEEYILASMDKINFITGGTQAWLPILTFILGVLACAAFFYFKKYKNKNTEAVNENTPLSGISNAINDEEESVK